MRLLPRAGRQSELYLQETRTERVSIKQLTVNLFHFKVFVVGQSDLERDVGAVGEGHGLVVLLTDEGLHLNTQRDGGVGGHLQSILSLDLQVSGRHEVDLGLVKVLVALDHRHPDSETARPGVSGDGALGVGSGQVFVVSGPVVYLTTPRGLWVVQSESEQLFITLRVPLIA